MAEPDPQVKQEDIATALRWANGECTLTQAGGEFYARGSIKSWGTSTYIHIARSLREAFKSGRAQEMH